MDYYNSALNYIIAIWAVLMIVIAIVAVIGIISYVLQSLGMYRIAQRRNHHSPWMAWVPYANLYLYAELIDRDLVVGNNTVRNFPVWYTVYPLIISAASVILQIIAMIPIVGWVFGGLGMLACSAASITISTYVKYRFYKKYRLDQVTLFTVLSALVPLAEPIIIFTISKNPFVGEAVTGTPPSPPPAPAPNTYPPTY